MKKSCVHGSSENGCRHVSTPAREPSTDGVVSLAILAIVILHVAVLVAGCAFDRLHVDVQGFHLGTTNSLPYVQ